MPLPGRAAHMWPPQRRWEADLQRHLLLPHRPLQCARTSLPPPPPPPSPPPPPVVAATVAHVQHRTHLQSYCAWLARTYFIDPPKHIQQAYKLLLDAQQVRPPLASNAAAARRAHCRARAGQAAIDALTDGTTAARVYNAVKETVQQRDAALVPHLSSSAGHSVGIEVREAFSLKESNKLRIKCVASRCA